ncbi:hypothetical protein CS063_16330 [Sporanaerobium hydrogeniformans]|uniref:Uncharacterized protein n=1 Tax=Sporanaerobium hydrogeniformans TaxID=3072179 RepID=A0AC61D9F1_9FIRM|nr:hypothetical protein [Sporanaerobium hydrogeniformans]PHV69353.1 hypothetical protein CS063_16330 [Sporanaerobium hydrogeniformans]
MDETEMLQGEEEVSLNLESENNTQASPTKKIQLKKINFKKQHAMIAISVLIVLLGSSVCSIIFLNQPKHNIPPYCQYVYTKGKTCKIHNVKHTKKDLKELHINDEEIAIQRELVEQIQEGAYFNGERLYKKVDEEELVKLKQDYLQEKEKLFERYLANKLPQEEQARYTYIVEELDTLENVMDILGIYEEVYLGESEADLNLKVKELDRTIQELNQKLTVLKEEKNQALNKEIDEDIAAPKQDNLIANLNQTRDKELVIPQNIASIGAIKKSELYK